MTAIDITVAIRSGYALISRTTIDPAIEAWLVRDAIAFEIGDGIIRRDIEGYGGIRGAAELPAQFITFSAMIDAQNFVARWCS
jgi:hypothetical protein